MGNPFIRQSDDLSTALAGGLPMLSALLSGGILPKLTGFLEQMDPDLLEMVVSQLSSMKPGRSE